MGKKDNLNTAMYDMFGVGKKTEETRQEEVKKETTAKPEAESKAVAPVKKPAAPSPLGVTYLAPGTIMEGNLRAKGDVEISGDFKGSIHADGCVTIHSNIEGNITGERVVLVDCKLHGDIVTSGEVVLNEKTEVNGNIQAQEVKCQGKVVGNLNVKANLSLGEKSWITGDIVTASLDMARGAFIKGMVQMGEN